jgi:hypothetical protein
MTRKLVSVVLGILILSSVAMAQDNAKISLLISDLDRNESHFMLGLDMIGPCLVKWCNYKLQRVEQKLDGYGLSWSLLCHRLI